MILAVIPARYASTRFPGKPLALVQGKPMIQRVYEQVQKAISVDRVVVATDDERIAICVRGFGGEVAMTRADHPSGTDRCAEVAVQYPDARFVLNIQGDEPFVDSTQIDLLINVLQSSKKYNITTLAKPITNEEQLFNPSVVKVVKGMDNKALYFSRHPIPYLRGQAPSEWLAAHIYYKHLGLYGFEASVLPVLAALPVGNLEIAESLEQLRWLENGYTIGLGITDIETIGIDTPEDLIRANLSRID